MGVAAAAALALAGIGQTAWAPLLHHGLGAGGGDHAAHAAPAVASAAWLVGWGLMVAAMMLPSAVPLVREVGGAVRERGGGRERAFTIAAFLGVWGAFGCAVLLGTALARGVAPGLLLIAVGAYQLTPAKRAALARCRAHVRLLPAGLGHRARSVGRRAARRDVPRALERRLLRAADGRHRDASAWGSPC